MLVSLLQCNLVLVYRIYSPVQELSSLEELEIPVLLSEGLIFRMHSISRILYAG